MPCPNCLCAECAKERAKPDGQRLVALRCDRCGHCLEGPSIRAWMIGRSCGILHCDGVLRETEN